MQSSHSQYGYRPDIDALRALAVIAVIVFHFNPKALPGGFLGVDVFFVISGYLISGILIKEHDSGGIRLAAFWARRIRRLLPAFAAMAISTCAAAWIFMPYSLAEAAAKQSIATCFALSNWYLWKLTDDYWGQAAESAPLLHTWSLSVEEQFYLFFPFLLWILLRYGGKRASTAFFLLFTAAAYAYSFFLGGAEHSRAFYFTTSRAWELLVGVSIALAGGSLQPWFGDRVPRWAGISLIIASFVLVDGAEFVPATGAVAAVIGSALVCWSGRAANTTEGWLISKPVLYIGKASYSLYLWHWPPLVFGSVFALAFPGHSFQTLALVVGLGLGLLSYHFIEPLGKGAKFVKTGAPALFGAVILLSLSIFIQRSPRYRPEALSTSADSQIEAQVYLIGDSHAEFLAPALEKRLRSNDIVMAGGISSGNAIAPGTHRSSKSKMDEWIEVQAQRLDFVRSNRPSCLIISCRWDKYTSQGDIEEGLSSLNDYRAANPGMTIILIGQVPIFECGEFIPSEWDQWTRVHGAPPPGFKSTERQAKAEKVYQTICRELGILYFDSSGVFASYAKTEETGNGVHVLYADDDHLSRRGAELMANDLYPLIAKALQK